MESVCIFLYQFLDRKSNGELQKVGIKYDKKQQLGEADDPLIAKTIFMLD